ncbi:FAS1-like dehydratase domain-containing protein [Lacisediminimonas profundi]|uniref:FAS1-like dehydratase domain-containing protein n=1 Tax=Lacisediminimonas profundi TaxID=2603856 RepID=UPI00124BB3E2|nr:MaoC family dehydratase N-terminal domain-containing protein [Lacisediminimonas profundi]
MVSKVHEGREYPPFRIRPDRELVRKYWTSMGVDPERREVPLTYLIFLRGESQGVDLFRDLDIPRRQALHGGQRYEWFAPVGPDDELDVVVRIDRVLEKASKSGPLWFVDATYEYRNAGSGALVLKEVTRLIKRGLQ